MSAPAPRAEIVEVGAEVGHVVVIGDNIVEATDLGELNGFVKADFGLTRFDLRMPHNMRRGWVR